MQRSRKSTKNSYFLALGSKRLENFPFYLLLFFFMVKRQGEIICIPTKSPLIYVNKYLRSLLGFRILFQNFEKFKLKESCFNGYMLFLNFKLEYDFGLKFGSRMK